MATFFALQMSVLIILLRVTTKNFSYSIDVEFCSEMGFNVIKGKLFPCLLKLDLFIIIF